MTPRLRVQGSIGVFLAVAALFLAVCVPVVLRGAPLADDFNNCVAPVQRGLGSFLAASGERLGAVRPARFVEILITTGVCQNLPFGVAIAVPLVFTLLVAILLRGVIRELGAPAPWPDVAGALWLLQPLGTEVALWPASFHVSLGLAFALASLRLNRLGRTGQGAIATLGACLSLEQAIFSLPLAVWLTARSQWRRRAATVTFCVVAAVLLVYAAWPGQDPRLRTPPMERVENLFAEPTFYVLFPAVGLGLHSIPLAVGWAFPLSVVVLVAGSSLGWYVGPRVVKRFTSGDGDNARTMFGQGVAVLGVIVLVNVPVILSVPRQGSPRTFAPTWLVLAGAVALLGGRVHWGRPHLPGLAGGLFVAGSLLSLAFSVSVRLASADFTEDSARQLAQTIHSGDVIAVCGIRRTVVEPAPRGSFALHELDYEWAAEDALYYYTGKKAEFRLAGELWNKPCPDRGQVDAVIAFQDLLTNKE